MLLIVRISLTVQLYFYCHPRTSFRLPKHLSSHPLIRPHLLHSPHQIMTNRLPHYTIPFILLMTPHKLPDPFRARPQLPIRPLADQI